MTMLIVVPVVLLAALLHAFWNTAVKGHSDKIIMMLMIAVTQASIALLMVPILGFPSAATWPWLLAAAIPHTTYKIAIAKAYDVGDMTRIYPISRGLSIVLVTVSSVFLLKEDISSLGLLGISAIAVGVFCLSVKESGDVLNLSLKAIFLCVIAGFSVALYSLLDAIGVRVSENEITLDSIATFSAWLFIFDGIGMMLFMFWYRGADAFKSLPQTGIRGIVAGCIAFACFWIAIWAFAYAPVAVVAALRETSVLFSLVLGKVILSETVTPRRIVFAALVLGGVTMLQFS